MKYTPQRLIRAARRRLRYPRLWYRALTGHNRIPRTGLRTLDHEHIAQQNAQPIRVLYMVGMPRTGTTLAKHQLGAHPHLHIDPFNFHYYDAWTHRHTVPDGHIVLDKRTENLLEVNEIWRCFSTECAFVCIVRDPRDQLISLRSFPGHNYIPRDRYFWHEWVSRYGDYMALAMQYFVYDRFYLLRYEDLVRHPDTARNDFFTWLGLKPEDYGNETITPNEQFAAELERRKLDPASAEAYQLAREYNLDEDPKFHANTDISDKSIGRWRNVEDPALSQVLSAWQTDDQAQRMMKLFGYGDEIHQPASLPGCRVFIP